MSPRTLILSRSNDEKQDMKLLEPFTYICRVPGKNMRSKFITAFNFWLKIPHDVSSQIEEIVHILHNSSLLLDDIQDSSTLRRGVPVAHAIYGVPCTINASNYCYFIALERILDMKKPGLIEIFVEQMLEIHRGQGMDLYWRDQFVCPSEEEYKQMITRKTGGPFIAAIQLMQLYSEDQRDFTKLTSTIGLFFQIRDDFINLKSKNYMENKTFCEDLTEGKFSFPIIHALNTHPEDNRISQILKQRTKDVEVKKYCVTLLEEMGSFDYTRQVLSDLKREILEELEKLGGNIFLEQAFEVLFQLE